MVAIAIFEVTNLVRCLSFSIIPLADYAGITNLISVLTSEKAAEKQEGISVMV